MTSEVHIAASTAKLLGYKVRRFTSDNSPFCCIGQHVICPKGSEVIYWTGYFAIDDMEMLGHWKVRLHMEAHFGIKTDHYWERM